ncbi:MAG TPA: amino acid ABC transporter substrate-binding protein [Hyphomicrobiales bacterium]|nr:amino acid ABC transporter substrate-binding protein [Hyphomicrobiales bacterium]
MKSLLVLGFLGIAVFAGKASAGPTLDAVRSRGVLKCGVSGENPGFSAPDSKGVIRGLDADICRAIGAAVLGDAAKVQFALLSSTTRFPALQSGEVDVLSRTSTMTFTRDTTLGLMFGPVIFYDGQGFMVGKSSGVNSAKDLNGATICVQPSTTTELNLADYFRANNMKFTPVVIESVDQARNAFFSGRCDVLTDDRSSLASDRALAHNPDEYVFLPETISKEPLAPAVRQGDDQWFAIVRWTVYALIEAEELRVNKENVDEKLKSGTPEIQFLLGKDVQASKGIGLSPDWAYKVIKQVGNYGELYEANVGERSPLKIPRGLNRLWTQGGLMYAPPIR